ncbi:MAG: hypothetical protein E6R03_14245 [Hyphomicrobiaceae bacterium]|nr:MAG: hypothetical protein E6R03_14245 [Hyphomicrobiaceae bacterium]
MSSKHPQNPKDKIFQMRVSLQERNLWAKYAELSGYESVAEMIRRLIESDMDQHENQKMQAEKAARGDN